MPAAGPAELLRLGAVRGDGLGDMSERAEDLVAGAGRVKPTKRAMAAICMIAKLP
jgi:hypothetical protein